MARVNSLLCYKGNTGAIVTLSIGSPCILTLSNHGMTNGTAIVFTTTGELPSGTTPGVTYYARYITIDTVNLYDSLDNALNTSSTTGIINTSGVQSGEHTVWSSYYYNLSPDEVVRYDGRVFALMKAWIAGRSSANEADDEYLEISDAFTEYVSIAEDYTITYAKIPSYRVYIETKVNGSRTPAFHRGKINVGYHLTTTRNIDSVYYPKRARIFTDGFKITSSYEGNKTGFYDTGGMFGSGCSNMILSFPYGRPLYSVSQGCEFYNILIYGSLYGLYLTSGTFQNSRVYNITCVKNTYGVYFTGTYAWLVGLFINVVSFGSSIYNWPSTALSLLGNGYTGSNAGKAGDNVVGLNPIKTVTESAFVDYANNDFRLSENSVLRDKGYSVPVGFEYDILDSFRPNYSAGEEVADLWDIGAFEFDSGNGLAPKTYSFSLTGIPEFSEIRIYEKSSTPGLIGIELSGVESHSGGPYVYEFSYNGSQIDIAVQIFSPGYEELLSYYTLSDSSQTIPITLQKEGNL